MITYMAIKNDDLDFEDVGDYVFLPFYVLLDIVFILFQPIFYIIYKKMEN